MKKLILISFLFSSFFIFGVQKSFSQYDDNGYHISDPRYHAEFNLKKFNYKNVWYPIIDSVTFKYYGKEEYAKSFGGYGEAFSVEGVMFSNFFLIKEKVQYATYLHNGYLYNDKTPKVLGKQKSYIEFIIFFFLFPILVLIIQTDTTIPRLDTYWIKDDFAFIIGSFFLALCFKFLLYDCVLTPLKINVSTIQTFAGSELMFGFLSYIVVLSFLTYIFRGLSEFVFIRLPIIFIGAVIAGISFGFIFEEIKPLSVVCILFSSVILYFFISILSNIIFFIKSKVDQ